MIRAILNNKNVYSFECTNRAADYRCPGCGERMSLVWGQKKARHFRHHPNSQCDWEKGETIYHINAKLWMYNKLKNDLKADVVELECTRFDGIRPDVAFFFQGAWFGIEFQRSCISEEEIIERTNRYAKQRIFIMWCVTEDIFKSIFSSDSRVRINKQARLFLSLHGVIFAFTGVEITALSYRHAYGENGRLKTCFWCKGYKLFSFYDLDCIPETNILCLNDRAKMTGWKEPWHLQSGLYKWEEEA